MTLSTLNFIHIYEKLFYNDTSVPEMTYTSQHTILGMRGSPVPVRPRTHASFLDRSSRLGGELFD
jgi:hypothetical protein